MCACVRACALVRVCLSMRACICARAPVFVNGSGTSRTYDSVQATRYVYRRVCSFACCTCLCSCVYLQSARTDLQMSTHHLQRQSYLAIVASSRVFFSATKLTLKSHNVLHSSAYSRLSPPPSQPRHGLLLQSSVEGCPQYLIFFKNLILIYFF